MIPRLSCNKCYNTPTPQSVKRVRFRYLAKGGRAVNWPLVPALFGAGFMVFIGVSALLKPSSLELVGVAATSPLGTSEIRAIFGGMFLALGLACLLLREPIVFAAVGAAWLADVGVRLFSLFVDRVPPRQALAVLGIGALTGAALLSGYWAA